MGKTSYGEFTFNKPTERTSIPGYARGGAVCAPTPMKKGGKTKRASLLQGPNTPADMLAKSGPAGQAPIRATPFAQQSPLAAAAAPDMAPMKKGGMANFEKSGKDVEKKGMKEGSKADMALDKKQMMGMKKGGAVEGSKADMEQDKAMIKKAFKQHDSQEHPGGKGTMLKLKKGGVPAFNRTPKC